MVKFNGYDDFVNKSTESHYTGNYTTHVTRNRPGLVFRIELQKGKWRIVFGAVSSKIDFFFDKICINCRKIWL